MGDLLCKLFNFVLGIFNRLVDVVATVITTIGNATVEVLSDLAVGVGEGIGAIFGSNPLLFGALALGGLWLLFGDSSNEKPAREARTRNKWNGESYA